MEEMNMGFATKAVHAGQHGDPVTGAMVSPMFLTSTFVWTPEKMERYQNGDKAGIFTYGRSRNPTQNEIQDKIKTLYGAPACLVTSSGMAAISLAILSFVHPGDHIISGKTIYGGTFGLFSHIFEEMKIDVTFLQDLSEESLNNALRPNTKLIYSESVYNPTLEICEVDRIAQWAKSKGIVSMIDNTFLSPYLFNPFEHGIDVVVESATKYINGHGDVIAGHICGQADFIERIRSSIYQEIGSVPSPFSCWLMLRGLKTLHLRMKAQCENAMEVAEWLEKSPLVEKVIYPGLASHPQHALATELYGKRGYGAMISFVVKGGLEGGQKFMNHVKLAKYAVSLGDLDTMAEQPATQTHGKMSREERMLMGIDDGMIRLSIGVEDVRDIIADVEQALNA